VQPSGILGLEDLDFSPPPPPEPLPAVLRAMHCWNFCRGRREQLPLYHAIHGLDDWDLTLALMGEIDDFANERP
jgi:hypothetical protein